MSERASFTSEYISCPEDYAALREMAEEIGNDKYLCFVPPTKWANDQGEEFEMPIIQGKVGSLGSGMEYATLEERLEGLEVSAPIRFTVMSDNGDIVLLILNPNGMVDIEYLRLLY